MCSSREELPSSATVPFSGDSVHGTSTGEADCLCMQLKACNPRCTRRHSTSSQHVATSYVWHVWYLCLSSPPSVLVAAASGACAQLAGKGDVCVHACPGRINLAYGTPSTVSLIWQFRWAKRADDCTGTYLVLVREGVGTLADDLRRSRGKIGVKSGDGGPDVGTGV